MHDTDPARDQGGGGLFDDARLAQARTLFPHTARGVNYLNHASTSPLSTRVTDAVMHHLRDRSEGKIDNYPADMEMVARCRESVRRLIHAPSVDRIAFCTNTSDPLNVIASGLPWRTGDRVLLNDSEFPANVYPYINLRRHGVEIDVILARHGAVTPEMVEDALTPRTRVVALSAVQFLSGHRADLSAIGALCRSRGTLLIVDAIQAVGAVRIDVGALPLDALAAGAQKWQMAPHGSGFLYLTEELQSRIQQAYMGWLAVQDAWAFRNYGQPLAASARRFEGGTLNMPSLWGMDAALSTLLEFGPERIEQHILALTGRLLDLLREHGGIRIITDFPPAERGGIVTVEVPAAVDAQRLFTSILAHDVVLALREGKLRFAPHFYNTPAEIASAVEVTTACLAGSRPS